MCAGVILSLNAVMISYTHWCSIYATRLSATNMQSQTPLWYSHMHKMYMYVNWLIPICVDGNVLPCAMARISFVSVCMRSNLRNPPKKRTPSARTYIPNDVLRPQDDATEIAALETTSARYVLYYPYSTTSQTHLTCSFIHLNVERGNVYLHT